MNAAIQLLLPILKSFAQDEIDSLAALPTQAAKRKRLLEWLDSSFVTGSPTGYVAAALVGRSTRAQDALIKALVGVRLNPSTTVQSLVFDRSSFDVEHAKAWAKAHDFRYGDVDVQPTTIRLRQKDPSRFRTFRTKGLTQGVQAVIARNPKFASKGRTYEVIKPDGRALRTAPSLKEAKEIARDLGWSSGDRAPRWVETGYPSESGYRTEWWADTCDYGIRLMGPRENPVRRRRNPPVTNPLLAQMLALRTAYQYAHWNAKNYADHLLFEKLYTSLDGGIDILAEISQQHVEPVATPKITDRSLMAAENRIIKAAERAIEQDRPDPGLENFLLGLIEHRERAKYLLNQRSDRAANLDTEEREYREAAIEGGVYKNPKRRRRNSHAKRRKNAGLWDDAEVISAYTREQAIRDGALVDVSASASEAGIRFPTAMTRAAWETTVRWTRGSGIQDESGRLWDVVWMLKNAIQRSSGGALVRFTVYVVPNTGRGRSPKPVSLKAVVGPGDHAEPVITIMLPDED